MIFAWTFSERVEERSLGLRLVVVIWGFFTDVCCFLVRSYMTFIVIVLFLTVQQM